MGEKNSGNTHYTLGDRVEGHKITQIGSHNVGVHVGDSILRPATEELTRFLDFLIYAGVVDERGVTDQAELEAEVVRREGRLGRVVEALKAGGVQALEAAVRHVAVPAVLETLDRHSG
jgi:hypothetical protein